MRMQNNEEDFTLLLFHISGIAWFPARNLFESPPPPFLTEEFCFDGLTLVSADQVQAPEFSRWWDGEQLQNRTAHQWSTCVLRELRTQFSSKTYLYTTELEYAYLWKPSETESLGSAAQISLTGWMTDMFPALIGW
jgi:hypothetical protein